MKTGVWLLFIVFNFTATNIAASTEARQKIILNSTVPPPFHTPENTGCFDQFYIKIFSALNIEIEIVEYPAKRALELANKGDIDGDFARYPGVGKSYSNLIQLPVSIYKSKLVLVSTESIIDSVESIFHNEKIGVVLSSEFIDSWIEKENQLKTRDYKQLLSLVKAKRIRYAFLPIEALYGYEKMLQATFFTKLPETNDSLGVFLLLNKKHQLLIPKLVEIMNQSENFANGSANICPEMSKKIRQQYSL